jgi:beta-glucosidase
MKLSSCASIAYLLVIMNIPAEVLSDHWDWSKLDVNRIVLPELCGVAISEYQVSGAYHCKKSNWSSWEDKGTHNGYTTIHGNQKSGVACDFWNNYKQDVQLIKELGCNAFRFSVEWSIIEPHQGEFSQEAIDHYHDLCDELIKNDITPMITLHHFTHPQWFESKGAFEKEQNIRYFERFCVRMFEELHDKVKLWCTINEPGPYVFQGYIHGVFPPGSKNVCLAAQVLKNMLIAHTRVYKKLKSLPGGNQAEIGIVHQYLTFEAHSWNLLEMIPCPFMNYIFNGVIMHFLATGELFPYIPYLRSAIEDAPACYDFIGLNFYSRVVIESNILGSLWHMNFNQDSFGKPSCLQGEVMTDMQYPVYPEGLYQAIKAVAKLGKPIYITENGVPDAHDDRRSLFIKRYLYALSRALREGYDIRGYFYWSLMDNFEWDEGYHKNFGLYEVDFVTQKRILKPGAQCYQRAIAKSPRIKKGG